MKMNDLNLKDIEKPPLASCCHHEKKLLSNHIFKFSTFFILFLICINSLFYTFQIINFGLANRENTELLQKIYYKINKRDSFNLLPFQPYSIKEKTKNFEEIENYSDKLQKRVRRSECPPCPTPEPPTDVNPNKDPVSILNQKVGNDAVYNITHSCKVPPIHIAKLKVDDMDEEFEGKSSTKRNAKQEAAYNGIKKLFPELLGEVNYKEEPPYNPTCTDQEKKKKV